MAAIDVQRNSVRHNDMSKNSNSTLYTNHDKTMRIGPNDYSHHRLMLENMSSLVEAENLTDMTIQCSGGYYIHTHKKLLSSVSSLARKLSREHGGIGDNKRFHLIINDVSRQTVLQFLKILYTGFAEGLKVGDFDSVHKLCELLGVSLNDSSVSFDSKSKNKDQSCQSSSRQEETIMVMAMGSGNSNPSITLENLCGERSIETEKIRKSDTRKEGSAKKRKGSRYEINSTKENKKPKKEPSKDPRVYCICREEERPGMIGCDYCDEWYHTQCLSLSKGEVQRLANEKWSCPNCEFKMVKSKNQDTNENDTDDVTPTNQEMQLSETNSLVQSELKFVSDSKNDTESSTSKESNNVVPNTLTCQINKRKRRNNTYGGSNDAEDENRIVQVQEDKNVIPSETTKSHGENEYHRTVEGVPHQENNVYETIAKEPSKASKINGHSASVVNKYQLTNNRMNLPVQKKPKQSFEAALFGELPTASSKRNNLVPEKLEKVAIKKAARKDNSTTECEVSSGKKGESIKSPSTINAKLSPQRKIAFHSRADEYASSSQYQDLKQSQKMKSRPKFLKDGDEESTISAQEGSEDHGPLRSFAPNTPNINDNQYPRENVQFTELRDIRRSVGSNPKHSKSQRIPKEDHDPSNPLFFCYICRSIFVSKKSLEEHKNAVGHYD